MSAKTPSVHAGYSRKWYGTLGRSAAPEWMGVPVVKHPIDLLCYQQIIHDTQPDVIVETGTFRGGSALYLAHLCDLLNHGRVISIDVAVNYELPDHDRIDYIQGASSTDQAVVAHVEKELAGLRGMVILDSAHNASHVLDELDVYNGFVAPGCYLIVEDTNRDGYPLAVGDILNNEGPGEALKRWQPTNKGFDIDRTHERWGFTQNPNGYLRRRTNG